MRSALVLFVLLLLISTVAAAEDDLSPPQTAAASFRAGWLEIARPNAALGQSRTEAYQNALTNAIDHFQAAVEAEPSSGDYRIGLVYACLAAGKYQRAYDEVREAIGRDRDNPLLYLLRAQAQAAFVYVDPDNRGQWFQDAMQSFEDAAALDLENSLAYVQAASVAYDAEQNETARNKLDQALARSGMRLYRLPIPEDLGSSQGESLRLWQTAQLRQWWELVSRAQNAANKLLKSGEAYEEVAARALESQHGAGDTSELSEETRSYLQTAEERYRTALELGRLIGNTQPNLVITVNSALNVMQDAYNHLASVARSSGSPEAARWEGESGVIQIGRQGLLGALTAYQQCVETEPPASVGELLKLEGGQVAGTMLGVALSPTEKPLAVLGGKSPEISPEEPPGEQGAQPSAEETADRPSALSEPD